MKIGYALRMNVSRLKYAVQELKSQVNLVNSKDMASKDHPYYGLFSTEIIQTANALCQPFKGILIYEIFIIYSSIHLF